MFKNIIILVFYFKKNKQETWWFEVTTQIISFKKVGYIFRNNTGVTKIRSKVNLKYPLC